MTQHHRARPMPMPTRRPILTGPQLAHLIGMRVEALNRWHAIGLIDPVRTRGRGLGGVARWWTRRDCRRAQVLAQLDGSPQGAGHDLHEACLVVDRHGDGLLVAWRNGGPVIAGNADSWADWADELLDGATVVDLTSAAWALERHLRELAPNHHNQPT